MTRYMLDTNMCIYLVKNQPYHVARRFAQCYFGDVVMSAITYAELQYGVAISPNSEREKRDVASSRKFNSLGRCALRIGSTTRNVHFSS